MLRFTLVLLAVCALPLPAFAGPPRDVPDHARAAIDAARQHDWNTARSEAKAARDPVLDNLIAWEYAQDPDSGAGFDDIARFIVGNPGWPGMNGLYVRAELSLKTAALKPDDVINWFADRQPITGAGKIALAEALMAKGQKPEERAVLLIREAWHDGDFDEPEEKRIVAQYGKWLLRQDDIRRIDRLLWENKISSARRMLPRVSDDECKLYKARMALAEDKKMSMLAVAQTPRALKNDPGLIYERMMYRARKGDDDGVREMLQAEPKDAPYPDKWWKQREAQVRQAIGEKKYRLAENLLAHHQATDSTLPEALWLEGWLDCEFLNRPQKAYELFHRTYDLVHFPYSRARAAYWAARAAGKAENQDDADRWYTTASEHSTTFYGQLAAVKHDSGAALHLPTPPVISGNDRDAIGSNILVKTARLCLTLGQDDLAARLLGSLAENAENDAQAALASDIGRKAGHDAVSVRTAKKAMRDGVVLITDAYPTPPTPDHLPIERALTLSITRQESEFDASAKSPAGALGLMQLLPSTAHSMARKLDLDFSESKLFGGSYNMTLGSAYLGRLIDGYGGSYVMAVAAYNAGPGNVHNWSQRFGTPGNQLDNAVNWIEEIPFSETRTYVQRVLGNLQVYRRLENSNESTKLKLVEDLER